MRMLRRLLIAATFIFALIAVPAGAEETDDSYIFDQEDDVFTEYVIQPGMNKAFVITECGKVIIAGVAIFDAPEGVRGEMMIAVRPDHLSEKDADYAMSQIMTEIIIKYKGDGAVIELSDISERWCL